MVFCDAHFRVKCDVGEDDDDEEDQGDGSVVMVSSCRGNPMCRPGVDYSSPSLHQARVWLT